MGRNSPNQDRGSRSGPRKGPGNNNSFRQNKDSKPFKKRFESDDAPEKKSRFSRDGEGKGERKPFDRKDKPSFRRDGEDRGERKPFDRKDKPSFRRDGEDRGERKPFDRKDKPSFRRDGDDRGERKPFDRKDKPSFRRDGEDRGERKPFDRKDKPSFRKDGDSRGERKPFDRKDKPSFRRDGEDRGERKPFDRDKKPFEGKRRDSDKSEKPAFEREERKPKRSEDSRPFRDRPKQDKPTFKTRTEKTDDIKESKPEEKKFDSVLKNVFQGKKKKEVDEFSKPQVHEDKVYGELEEPKAEGKYLYGSSKKQRGAKKDGKKKWYEEEEEKTTAADGDEEQMPLNKYIAYSGECSRRDAAELVKQGKVKVNGELVLDPGHKVKYSDNVTLVGKKLKPQKDRVYILLNKPKGYITTNEDPQGRKTVMDLVTNSGVDRLFPVGRLDRDTTGLLLITNDGELTQKLSHPSYNIKKVYHVTLDKPMTKADFEKVVEGVELEDGKAIVDELAYLETKNELGLEIHSGKNRIVRRIFESLGYVVEKLDRMMYAGLTKKNLPRGKWRHLEPREVILLKHFKS